MPPPSSPRARLPPMRPTHLSSPLRPPPPYSLSRCGALRRYGCPSLRSGDGRPRFGHGPAAGAAWRGLRRGLAIPRPAVTPSASTAGLRVELARPDSLRGRDFARLRLGRCPRRPRGPVPCGQSGPREDRRGSSRRSAALCGPAGFGWGRARILLSCDCCLILLTVGGFKRWRIHIVTTEEEPCYGFVPRCVLMTLPVYEKM